jgi:catechol 2,3-dioxygenase-like lactoylglutathione lyase family enzyme
MPLFISCLKEQRMTSPIANRIGAVFIPVSDMDRAIRWYNHLLGLPPLATLHEGHIYDLRMSGDTMLILDGHKPVTNSSQPLCFLWTDDIQAAYAFLTRSEIELVAPPEDIGSVTTLTFHDPDHNLLMVCQRN